MRAERSLCDARYFDGAELLAAGACISGTGCGGKNGLHAASDNAAMANVAHAVSRTRLWSRHLEDMQRPMEEPPEMSRCEGRSIR